MYALYDQSGNFLQFVQSVQPLPGGFVGLVNPDGTIVSQQPTGQLGTRAAGSPFEAYETASQVGSLVTYAPIGTNLFGDPPKVCLFTYLLLKIPNA